jgi:hypothetical protein
MEDVASVEQRRGDSQPAPGAPPSAGQSPVGVGS